MLYKKLLGFQYLYFLFDFIHLHLLETEFLGTFLCEDFLINKNIQIKQTYDDLNVFKEFVRY